MGHKRTFHEEDYDFMRWFLSRTPEQVRKPTYTLEQEQQCLAVARKYATLHPNRSDPFSSKRMMHYLRNGMEDLNYWLKEYKLA